MIFSNQCSDSDKPTPEQMREVIDHVAHMIPNQIGKDQQMTEVDYGYWDENGWGAIATYEIPSNHSLIDDLVITIFFCNCHEVFVEYRGANNETIDAHCHHSQCYKFPDQHWSNFKNGVWDIVEANTRQKKYRLPRNYFSDGKTSA